MISEQNIYSLTTLDFVNPTTVRCKGDALKSFDNAVPSSALKALSYMTRVSLIFSMNPNIVIFLSNLQIQYIQTDYCPILKCLY